MKQITITLVLLALLNSCNNSQNLKIEEIKKFADELIISKEFKTHVIKTVPSIDNIQIALLEMPYREFPSIIILKWNEKDKKWIRTFECLSPGIQNNPSGLLDWHTKSCGIDFTTNDTEIYHFTDKVVTAMVESTLEKRGSVFIPYQNFFHMNTADSLGQKDFEPYTIDKTEYLDFANKLFENKYNDYPTNQCMMFDTPKTSEITFRKVNGLYEIHAFTNNSQEWIYTFDGVDDNYRYLTNKKIVVK